jgi:hypothetical protein
MKQSVVSIATTMITVITVMAVALPALGGNAEHHAPQTVVQSDAGTVPATETGETVSGRPTASRVSIEAEGMPPAPRGRQIVCVCDDEGCCCAPVGKRCHWHPY